MYRVIKTVGLLVCAFGTIGIASAQSRGWQCVTYARAVTDVAIRGNANTWWGQAEGRYTRGAAPSVGAVLAFKSAPGMRAGHVAVVREILGARELRIEHANWSHRGAVERDARAIDVSEAGDWSKVRVSYGNDMGTRINPAFGFIYPHAGSPTIGTATSQRSRLDLSDDVVQLAMLER